MFLYFFVIFMTFLGALGALYFKKTITNRIQISLLAVNPYLYTGLLFYVTSALLNIMLLNYLDYSILYPMTAITYIWSMLLAKFCLGEKITIKKIIGVLLIFFGVILLIF